MRIWKHGRSGGDAGRFDGKINLKLFRGVFAEGE